MPHLMALAREQITSVLKAELRRKDQIKPAIVVYCNYMKMEKKDKGSYKLEIPIYEQNMCVMHAFDAYFASKHGITKNLQRLSVIKPYSNKVNLDGIPMPTPICPRIFQKIEAQNPEISINVCEWKEETASIKPVIASKNFYVPNSCQVAGCEHPRPNECMTKRPHVIYLMTLTDINKAEDTGKYSQRNHFLWIKNPDGLIFKDTKHNGKKYLCYKCFQSLIIVKLSIVYNFISKLPIGLKLVLTLHEEVK